MQMTEQQVELPEIKGAHGIRLSEADFKKLSSFIYTNYGIHLPFTKRPLIESRLQKRLRLLNMPSFKEYIKWVTKGGEHDEVVSMIDIISTNKTDFFRENAHFDLLMNRVLPSLNHEQLQDLKIWCAGASSGEEVYTIAMTMEEFISANNANIKYSILGTDISSRVLQKGNMAIYNEQNIAGIPYDLKKKYFLKSKDRMNPTVRVIKKIRDKVKFQRHNLMDDHHFTGQVFDIIFCRNVLIYFDKPTQERITFKLNDKLKKGGYFFLGHSESIIGIDVPLKQVAHTAYQKN